MMHDDGTRFIMRAAPGGAPPPLQPGASPQNGFCV